MKKIIILLGLVASSTLGWACGPAPYAFTSHRTWYAGPAVTYAPQPIVYVAQPTAYQAVVVSSGAASVVYVTQPYYCAPSPQFSVSWSPSFYGHHSGHHHR